MRPYQLKIINMAIKNLMLVIFAAPLLMIGCKTAKTPVVTSVSQTSGIECGTQVPVFQLEILPVFEKKCNNCHGKRAAGGYNFTIMDDIYRAANNGELLSTIRWEPHFPQMPQQRDKLDDATIHTIECWIKTGMK